MQQQVIASIEIEDEQIDYYSSVIIRQQFNEHHEFIIRIRYDVLEKIGSFNLNDAQRKIGKLAIIKLLYADTLEAAYEFRGLICEISMEQSENFTSDLILKGYSPTILLDNGPHLCSFYKKDIKQIVQQLTQSLQGYCQVKANPQYQTEIKYICQYRESTFHFLNRLSSEFGEWLYYDGVNLYFGKPSDSSSVEVAYGEDIHNLQIKLRLLPLAFSNYSYVSKDDKFLSYDAPSSVDGLDQYANHALQESGKVFTDTVISPVRQRVESKGDLEGFVKKQKAAKAADLEVLSGSSSNPAICIGAIADVKIGTRENNVFSKEDGGKFLITSVEHHVTANGKYYNTFEGIPSGIEVVPVKNIVMPVAEPQIALVKDNKDPDNLGRVRVQMLWQQQSGEMTDWLRVMTPDAGSGKGNSKNRGYVFVPEPGDEVLVCFRYNDPDRPFVLGSIFHGKTAAGGGDGNKTRSIITPSGCNLTFKDKSITIEDANNNVMNLDGEGNIKVTSSESIELTCGDSKIEMKKDGTIKITGNNSITLEAPEINASADQEIKLEAPTINESASQELKMEGKAGASLKGLKVGLEANTTMEVKGGAQLDLKGGGMASLSAGLVKIN